MSEITLYRCTCDRKKLVKYNPSRNISYLNKIGETIDSFRIKEPSSIINPVILLSRATVGGNWASVNYAYIPSFNRYYFVDNITCEHDGLLELELHADVLQSYYSQLLNTAFEIARSESLNSKYYIDPEKAIIQRRVVQYLQAKNAGGTAQGVPQSAANTKKYFITVAGG